MRSTIPLLAAALLLTQPLVAQSHGPADGRDLPAVDIERVATGAQAPDFTLPEYGGGDVTLSQFRGESNVVLVFYRGYWCPFCIEQLTDLRSLLDGELRRDTELLVVSVDPEQQTRMTVTRVGQDGQEADFRFLMDVDHTVIDRYGILNESGSRRGIPHPATFVIDKEGVVRWRDVQTDYRVRPSNDQVLSALTALR